MFTSIPSDEQSEPVESNIPPMDPELPEIDLESGELEIVEDLDYPGEPSFSFPQSEAKENDDEEYEEDSVVPDYFLPTSRYADLVSSRIFIMTSRALEIKSEKAHVEYELKKARISLDRISGAAVLNWDKDNKCPKNPAMPYNDGSNEEKRAATTRELFKDQIKQIDELQDKVDQMALDLLDAELYEKLARIEADNVQTLLSIAKEARLAGIEIKPFVE